MKNETDSWTSIGAKLDSKRVPKVRAVVPKISDSKRVAMLLANGPMYATQIVDATGISITDVVQILCGGKFILTAIGWGLADRCK